MCEKGIFIGVRKIEMIRSPPRIRQARNRNGPSHHHGKYIESAVSSQMNPMYHHCSIYIIIEKNGWQVLGGSAEYRWKRIRVATLTWRAK
jgi:hypothetical protein